MSFIWNKPSWVTLCNAGPQCGTHPSEGRIRVTSPCPIWLLAEPPANHTTLWKGEIWLGNIMSTFNILSQRPHLSSSLPYLPVPYCFLPCFAPALSLLLLLGCDSPRRLSLVLWGNTLSRCFVAPCCQSRPRRPAHKHRAVRDEQDMKDADDPWSGWETEINWKRRSVKNKKTKPTMHRFYVF